MLSATIYGQQQYTATDNVLSMTIDGQVNTILMYFFQACMSFTAFIPWMK
jgi:hypothetical protein